MGAMGCLWALFYNFYSRLIVKALLYLRFLSKMLEKTQLSKR